MKSGKYEQRPPARRRRRNNGSKVLLMVLALTLIAGITIGGALAYLTDETQPITNTFELGKFTYKLALNGNKPNTDGNVTMPTLDPLSGEKEAAAGHADFKVSGDPTLEGYTFGGWHYDEAGNKPYADISGNTITVGYGDEYDRDGSAEVVDILLYAKWTPITYTVQYNGNGATAGSMSDSTHTYDVESNLTTNAYTRTGYEFLGWSTDSSATAATYTDGQAILNLTSTDKDVVELYAVWKQMDFKVSFDTQVDGMTNPDPKTVTYLKPYGDLPVLTRAGYTFTGWSLDKAGTKPVNKDTIVNIPEDHTLYAQWEAGVYVIRYHANGGEGTMEDQIIKYDKPTDLRANTFTKSDYSFMGWALTPDGEVKYIDKQIVVNLKESGYVDLYAVWAQNTHTVTFDYNGGTGSPESKQFQNGKAYGQLPEYPVHPTKPVGDNKVMTYLFTGWYTERTGGTRVYPTTIANTTKDHTLYAHWQEAPSNQIITNMVVKNNPDDNHDGVVDDLYLQFTCTSNFEKYNIPLNNLIPGQTYELTYTASNNASFGDYYKGYSGSVYGSYILATNALTGGRIEHNYEESEYVAQVLADWNSRVEPDGNNDGSQAAINDTLLRGPWTNKKISFTATASTMYWTWDFGLMQDNIQNDYNMTDIVLKPVAPKINFGEGTFATSNAAKITAKSNTDYTAQFTIDGDGGCETYYWTITGLTPGATYTLTFDHKVTGSLYPSTSYQYGCGISSNAPTTGGSAMDRIGATWLSGTKYYSTVNQVTSTTLTFTPTGSTVYWAWNMGGCSDTTDCTTFLNITNFSVTHTGGKSITFRTATSNASLEIEPEISTPAQIALNWSGIDDTNLDGWYPVDEQDPTAGDSYELAFEPLEGYAMSETITVAIDGVTYEVYTDGRATGEDGMPAYDPETNVLTIPGELLTETTETVSITASAVQIHAEDAANGTDTPDDPTNPTDPTDPAEESAAAVASATEATLPPKTEEDGEPDTTELDERGIGE